MPCRTRAAAQTLQHLWISDSVLEEAFNRFLRVSHAQKRHGSSVPGPLEAHRRLAKRRASVATVPSGGGSVPPLPAPSHEWGGLLGLALKKPVEVETGWKWEAPKALLPMQEPPSGGQPAPWWWYGPRQEERYDQWVEQDQRLAKFLEIPPDPVDTSKVAFEELLKAHDEVLSRETIQQEDIRSMLDFLQSSANESDAQLTLRLMEWLGRQRLSEDILSSMKDIVLEKIALATITHDEVSNILHELLCWPEDAITTAAATTVIDAVVSNSNSKRKTVLLKTTRLILEGHEMNPFDVLPRMRNWLSILRNCAFNLQGYYHGNDIAWSAIYACLSRYYRPSDFAEHFSTLERQDFAIVLLNHWVLVFAGTEESKTTLLGRILLLENRNTDKSLHFHTHKTMRKELHDGSIHLSHIKADFARHRKRECEWQDSDGYSTKNPLIEIFSLLSKHNVPYTALLADLFKYWHATLPPHTIKNLFWDLHDNLAIGIPPPLAVDTIQRFILNGNLEYAFQVFHLVPALPLLQCFDLPLRLIERGRTPGEKIMHMLNRRLPENSVPMHERERSWSPLTQPHIDLVHLVAGAWAESPHVQPRARLRRVWECYRFLRDRGAPLTSFLSRALVKAGISHYLRIGKPLAKRQVWFVMSVVHKIEGPAIAQQLDRLVFETWRKRRGYKVDPEKGWVPVDTVKVLEENARGADEKVVKRARWRLKGWVRDKQYPVPTPSPQARRPWRQKVTRENCMMPGFGEMPTDAFDSPTQSSSKIEQNEVDAGLAENASDDCSVSTTAQEQYRPFCDEALAASYNSEAHDADRT